MRDIKVYAALFDGGLHNGQLKWGSSLYQVDLVIK
jgi:hypothetical protein